MSKPVFGQREEFILREKQEKRERRYTSNALADIRQLGIGIATVCQRCSQKADIPVKPWEATEDAWPCDHLQCYDRSLRKHGLDALNAAAKIWAAEKEQV